METYNFSWVGGTLSLTTSDHITRSAYVPDMDDDFSQITLRAPRTSAIAALLMLHAPPTVTIQIPEIGWVGSAITCRYAGSEVEINCAGIGHSGERNLLEGKTQRHCRFALFSRECGAVEQSINRDVAPAFLLSETTIAIAGAELTADWIGGYLYIEGDIYRLASKSIANITWWDVDKKLPFGWTNANLVEITRGCRHTVETCINKPNFGGFPKIEG